ncbi:MAG: membrane bound O-acyl transferase family-domain-containing protein [Pseudomonadota bacterium]|nr:membrane bound O-acyl transferase family-domain-containing protein [Pseudomonadota bacterium]
MTVSPLPALVAVLIAEVALSTAVAWLAAGSRVRKVGAGAATVALGALPWCLPASLPLLRGLSALFALVVLMKLVELLRERTPRPFAERLVHVYSLADLRLARHGPPRFDLPLLGSGVVCGAVAALLLIAAGSVPAEARPGPLAARWLLGVASFYLSFEAIDRLARTAYLLGGAQVEPTQRAPILAPTLADFWGKRWNAIVRRWLASVFFLPLARKGHARLGILAAFVVSAVIHAYLMLPGLGAGWALCMGGFFLIHGALCTVERALGVSRWPRALAHVWVLTALLATMPLFIEPLLLLLGFRPVIG